MSKKKKTSPLEEIRKPFVCRDPLIKAKLKRKGIPYTVGISNRFAIYWMFSLTNRELQECIGGCSIA